MKKSIAHYLLPLAAVFCLLPFVSSGVGLLLGIAIALTVGNPYREQTRKISPKMLTYSVVGLGAAMDLAVVGKVGLQGIGYTVVGIASTLALGTVLGKILRVEATTSLLVSVGTAICGGSAIAAVASAIRAKSHPVSMALVTVFLLNAAALFIFPLVGHHFALSQTQFGLWSALAIHDTSSVVGSAMQYGPDALQLATTVKLARALWIVPVTFAVGWFWTSSEAEAGAAAGKVKRPWFIVGFLLAAALVTWVPALRPAGEIVAAVAKRMLVVTLFLIGSGLTRDTLRGVGLAPFVQGVLLWITVATATLAAILAGFVH